MTAFTRAVMVCTRGYLQPMGCVPHRPTGFGLVPIQLPPFCFFFLLNLQLLPKFRVLKLYAEYVASLYSSMHTMPIFLAKFPRYNLVLSKLINVSIH
jgi:hypothetical protein